MVEVLYNRIWDRIMLNLYDKFDKPETLPGYDGEYHTKMVFKMLNESPERLSSEDKKLLARNTDVIIKDPKAIYMYADYVIQGRWEEGEPYIMKNTKWAVAYARGVIKGRFEAAEPYIMKDAAKAFLYASNIFQGRWEEAEPYIMKDPESAFFYARNVLGHDPNWVSIAGHERGRWPEAEPYIRPDSAWWLYYKDQFRIEE